MFYRDEPHPDAPKLLPDPDGFIWMPDSGFDHAFAQNATAEQIDLCKGRDWLEADYRILNARGKCPGSDVRTLTASEDGRSEFFCQSLGTKFRLR